MSDVEWTLSGSVVLLGLRGLPASGSGARLAELFHPLSGSGGMLKLNQEDPGLLKYDENDADEWRQAVRHAEWERNMLRQTLGTAYHTIDRLNEQLWEEREKSAALIEELRSMGGYRW